MTGYGANAKQPSTHTPDTPEHIKHALRALYEGKANEGQQQQFLQWLLWEACDVHGISFRNDQAGGDRATAFNEGRRFVGVLIQTTLGLLRPTMAAPSGNPEARGTK